MNKVGLLNLEQEGVSVEFQKRLQNSIPLDVLSALLISEERVNSTEINFTDGSKLRGL